MSIDGFLIALPNLRPKEATTALRELVRPLSGDVNALAALASKVDAAKSQSKLTVYQYSLIITVTQSLPWSLQVLKSGSEPLAVGAAIDILAGALLRTTEATLVTIGGIAGLVTLIDEQLPLAAVKRLFKSLSAKRNSSPAVHALVDQLLSAAFLFLDEGSSKPLERLAPAMAGTLVLASSPAVLKQTLPRLARLMSLHQWTKLVERYPTVISELVMIQVEVWPAQNDWYERGVLERPSWLTPTLSLLLKADSPPSFGIDFFAHFVRAYAQFVKKKFPTDVTLDILSRINGRVGALDQYVEYYLDSIDDCGTRTTAALDLLEQFVTIRLREGSYHQHPRLMWVLVDLFAKRPELWEQSLQHPVPRADPLLKAICETIENMDATTVNAQNIQVWFKLDRQPRGARFPLMHIAFSVAGLPLTVAPSDGDASRFPVFPIPLLSILSPGHARGLVQIGSDARGTSWYLQYSHFANNSQAGAALSAAFPIVSRLEAARQPDAYMALMRAAWIGAQRGPAGDAATTKRSADGTDGIADVDRDIGDYLKLSFRSPDAQTRQNYATMALTLCLLAQSPRRFSETTATTLERFAKDPQTGNSLLQWITHHCDSVNVFLAGPAGVYLNKANAARSGITPALMRQWVASSTAVVNALLKTVKVMLFSPECNASWHYAQSVTAHIRALFKKRVETLPRLVGTVFATADEAIDVLLRPLGDLIIAWDKMKVIDHQDELGFGWRDCVPLQLGSISTNESIAPKILDFLISLGEQREELWRAARDKLHPPTYDGAPPSWAEASDTATILPFNLTVPQRGKDWCCDMPAPPRLTSYCEDILFCDLSADGALGAAISTTDRHHFHHSMFQSVLSLYLYWSRFSELEAKIVKLMDHYSRSGTQNYSVLVIQSAAVQNLLWQLPELCRRAESWLPSGPSNFVKSTAAVEEDAVPALVFNPMALLPAHPFRVQSETPKLLEARNPQADPSDAISAAFSPFLANANADTMCLTKGSARRLAAFTIAWLTTEAKLPERVPDDDLDLVSVATFQGRIDKQFSDNIEVRAANAIHTMLRSSISALSDDEVFGIVKYLLEQAESPTAQRYAFMLLRLVRKQRPALVHAQAMTLLSNSTLSNWHRHVACPAIFAHFKPIAAVKSIQALVDFVRMKDTEADDDEDDNMEEDEEEKPFIKITTAKLVVNAIGEAISCGILHVDNISLMGKVHKSVNHQSVGLGIAKELVTLATYGQTLQPTRDSPAFNALLPFVEVATRLSEGTAVRNADWDKLELDSNAVFPTVDTEHPIATLLLHVAIQSSSKAFAEKYAAEIIVPTLLGQVRNRTRWLQAAVKREGGSFFIEATYDTEFNAASLHTTFRDFLPHPPLASSESDPSSVLDLVQRRATLVLRRKPYEELVKLLRQNHPADWQKSAYGKTLVSLVSAATSEDSSWIYGSVTGLVQALLSDKSSESVHEQARASLVRIGDAFLESSSMAIASAPPPTRPAQPFALFANLINHGSIASAGSGDNGTYSTLVRPILQHFLETATRKATELTASIWNADVLYKTVITQLQLLLLPHPAYAPFSQNPNKHKNWVNDLLAIVQPLQTSTFDRRYFELAVSFMNSTGNRLWPSDAMAVIEDLLQTASTGSVAMMRYPAIELAVQLAKSYKARINASDAKDRLAAATKNLQNSEDAIIQVIAFNL
ncbi:hypothetical protein BKA62DRAFT_654366 [Auriculariales sp. MPI-PUGE-AT-0066]|nr:hypothetical protein BKA62DRAFT_654366 [Auriculariales sp. MPI-PUGE-AT-0066]